MVKKQLHGRCYGSMYTQRLLFNLRETAKAAGIHKRAMASMLRGIFVVCSVKRRSIKATFAMLSVVAHIHFICRHNAYRSRLAEAYAKSLLPKQSDTKISSSGIEAGLNLYGDVDPATLKVLETEPADVREHLTPMWRQTTQKLLDEVDLVVFMNDSVYEDAQKRFDVSGAKTLVWHIQDTAGIYPLVKEQVALLMKAYG